MKRRKFIQYAVLGSTSSLTNLHSLTYRQTSVAFSKTMSSQRNYDWIFLYWMPYDNDLSRFGKSIIQMISRGLQTNNILVVVESDFSGARQLSRSIIRKGKIDIQYLETTDSSNEEVFTEYLNWAKAQFQSEHWAIVFLGHGGRLLEISPDDNPTQNSDIEAESKWMNIQKLSDVIDNFNRAVDNRVELLFFQNCTKGNIEVNYTFRDSAKYTLSSQLTLGAPNYYYESLLQYLGDRPNIDGGQVAEKIMEFERKDMYHSLTVINNHYLHALPEKLNPLIDSILASDIKVYRTFISSLLSNKAREVKIGFYRYSGEKFIDVVEFFQELTKRTSHSHKEYNDFIDFFHNSLIYKMQNDGELFSLITRSKYKNCCGIGLFLPTSIRELEAYRSLPIYSDLKLIDLFNAILFNCMENRSCDRFSVKIPYVSELLNGSISL